MKALYCILITLVFSACSSKEIYYKYNGVTITRVDHAGEVRLFYGDDKEDNGKQPFVKAEYSGLNSGVDGYLIFHEDTTVEVIGMAGYFSEGQNKNKSIYISRIDNSIFDSTLRSCKNKIRISDAVNLEKKRNLESGTKVRAVYP